jgi:porin
VAAWCGAAVAQKEKKTDDDKPGDPTRAESTVQEKTPGLLPNPLQKYGIKLVCRDVYRGDFGQRLGRHPAGRRL